MKIILLLMILLFTLLAGGCMTEVDRFLHPVPSAISEEFA